MQTENETLEHRLRADADWLNAVAEGGDDARIVGVLREAADELKAIGEALAVFRTGYTPSSRIKDDDLEHFAFRAGDLRKLIALGARLSSAVSGSEAGNMRQHELGEQREAEGGPKTGE